MAYSMKNAPEKASSVFIHIVEIKVVADSRNKITPIRRRLSVFIVVMASFIFLKSALKFKVKGCKKTRALTLAYKFKKNFEIQSK